MDAILEYGIIINGLSEENKAIIDKRGYEISMLLRGNNALHFVSIPDCPYFLTCNVLNGQTRFGLYDYQNKKLIRYISNEVIDKISDNTWEYLIDRLNNTKNKQLHLYPLNDLWDASIQAEYKYIDKNNIAYLSKEDKTALDIEIE